MHVIFFPKAVKSVPIELLGIQRCLYFIYLIVFVCLFTDIYIYIYIFIYLSIDSFNTGCLWISPIIKSWGDYYRALYVVDLCNCRNYRTMTDWRKRCGIWCYISPRRAQLIECWPPLTTWSKYTYAKWKIICNIWVHMQYHYHDMNVVDTVLLLPSAISIIIFYYERTEKVFISVSN